MPQLIFKNCTKQIVKEISKTLLKPLSDAVGCPEDWFTFSHIEMSTFSNSVDITKDILVVDIYWFPRSKEVKDSVAKIITEQFMEYYKNSKEITVIFYDLEKENYYENGECYV